MKTVLFACVHNAGRSQMAAAFFNDMAHPGAAHAISAGTQPGERVHAEVAATMRELGFDLSGVRPQRLTEELARRANLLVTMGCGETCPVVPGLERIDWQIDDPKGGDADAVRSIREDVRREVERLLNARGWQRSA